MGIIDAALNRDTHTARINPYEELATAIVCAAADDYRRYRRALRTASDFEIPIIKRNIFAIERFFKSDYAETLCFGNASVIWERLQKEGGRKC